MSTNELRGQIHQLIEDASEGYLVEVLDILKSEHSSPAYKYSKDDIEKFEEQSQLYKQGKLKTFTFNEVKEELKDRYPNNNAL